MNTTTTSSTLSFLKTLTLFTLFPEDLLARLANQATTKHFRLDELISREGEQDPNCYILTSGKIRIVKKRVEGGESTLRFARPGEVLGLTSMFFPSGRSASMIAVMESDVIVIPHTLLLSYLHSNEPSASIVSEALLKELSTRIRLKNARLIAGSTNDKELKTKVAVFDTKPYIQEVFAAQEGERFSFTYLSTRLTPTTARLCEGFPVINVFVNDVVNAETLQILKECGVELITLRCAGFNNVDIATCAQLGISVTRVPAYSPHAVAEHALALLMTLNRKIHKSYERVRNGDFRLDGLVGMDLFGKTVGVVGTGKIGECFVAIMRGLGCNVLAYDLFPKPEIQKLSDVSYVSLSELLSRSDVVSLHAPLNKESYHMINEQSLATMKPGALLINTSRGALIDARALIEALKNKALGGAGLDVYEEEEGYFFEDLSNEVITDDVLARLFTFNNVIITGHQAFLTTEALHKIAETTVLNIHEFLDGKRGNELTNHVPEPK
jgi:D-lactate dehydrogenase